MNLPPAYDLAVRAGRLALEHTRASGPNGLDVEIAVGSFLFWVVALNDRVRELNEAEYSQRIGLHPGSSVMPGLKLARNALAHGVVAVSRPAGFTVPETWPLVIHPWRWTSLSEVTTGWVPTETRFLAVQKQTFDSEMAERAIAPTLESALDWIESFGIDAPHAD
jgi:hypothetical protein